MPDTMGLKINSEVAFLFSFHLSQDMSSILLLLFMNVLKHLVKMEVNDNYPSKFIRSLMRLQKEFDPIVSVEGRL